MAHANWLADAVMADPTFQKDFAAYVKVSNAYDQKAGNDPYITNFSVDSAKCKLQNIVPMDIFNKLATYILSLNCNTSPAFATMNTKVNNGLWYSAGISAAVKQRGFAAAKSAQANQEQ